MPFSHNKRYMINHAIGSRDSGQSEVIRDVICLPCIIKLNIPKD
jgi:hypothetical protein